MTSATTNTNRLPAELRIQNRTFVQHGRTDGVGRLVFGGLSAGGRDGAQQQGCAGCAQFVQKSFERQGTYSNFLIYHNYSNIVFGIITPN